MPEGLAAIRSLSNGTGCSDNGTRRSEVRTYRLMDELIESLHRQADAVGFSGRFPQQCPAAGNRRPPVPARTGGLYFFHLLTFMTDAGPDRGTQGDERRPGTRLLRPQKNAMTMHAITSPRCPSINSMWSATPNTSGFSQQEKLPKGG
jgi:hypothetical protein